MKKNSKIFSCYYSLNTNIWRDFSFILCVQILHKMTDKTLSKWELYQMWKQNEAQSASSILYICIINQKLFSQEDTRKPQQTPCKASNACQKTQCKTSTLKAAPYFKNYQSTVTTILIMPTVADSKPGWKKKGKRFQFL